MVQDGFGRWCWGTQDLAELLYCIHESYWRVGPIQCQIVVINIKTAECCSRCLKINHMMMVRGKPHNLIFDKDVISWLFATVPRKLSKNIPLTWFEYQWFSGTPKVDKYNMTNITVNETPSTYFLWKKLQEFFNLFCKWKVWDPTQISPQVWVKMNNTQSHLVASTPAQ